MVRSNAEYKPGAHMMLTNIWRKENPWTDTRVELLTKFVSEGCSGSQIAAELGGGITRNAVIGKIHRLGLSGPKSRGHAKPKPKPWAEAGAHERTWQRWKAKEKNGPSYRRVASAPAHSFEAVTIGREATDLEPEAIADPVTLLDLQEHSCRWPVDRDGEPMMYCGAGNVTGLSYCARHCRMAYVAPQSRRVSYYVPGEGRARYRGGHLGDKRNAGSWA
jgi:GcrA cell cycle regulator